jgi:hypothetical protein
VEVKAAISKMKRGKVAGPDEITLEMVLAFREEGIVWLYYIEYWMQSGKKSVYPTTA